MMNEVIIGFSVALALPFLWVGVMWVAAHVGPWSRLADEFPGRALESPTRFRFVSLNAGLTNYNNCLTAEATHDALTLQVYFPFRPFHPPITLPREAVTDISPEKVLFTRGVSFTVAGRRIKLFGAVATSDFWDDAFWIPPSN